MLVQLGATALYAILDQISRNQCPVGVLVGKHDETSIYIASAFELKWLGQSIDYDYLSKRLKLLLAVFDNVSLVGLYLTTGEAPTHILEDFRVNGDVLPPIYISINDKEIECFSFKDHSPLLVNILAEDTETIATKTLHLHANYTGDEPELTQVTEEATAYSLQQLERKIRAILAAENLGEEAERDLVYLANKLSFSNGEDRSLELITSRLSILTNLLSVTRAANAYFTPKTAR